MKIIKKYQLPKFLEGTVGQDEYEKWLSRKAATHVRRDRAGGNSTATNEAYKIAIHKAVLESKGKDAYTDETLDWKLLSQYNNNKSKEGGRLYKRKFALLPSVDHVGNGLGRANFKICSWRTNDAKSDLSLPEFVQLCRKVVSLNKVK